MDRTPLGHSIASHHILGWCCHCPGRTAAWELAAWQVWAGTLPEVRQEIDRQQPAGARRDAQPANDRNPQT